MKGKSNSGTQFMRNAAVLSVTSLILRFSGMYMSVFMSSKLTAQGIGLYQLASSVYMLLSGLSVSGISVAVSRLTAESCAEGKSGRGVLSACLKACIGLSLLSSVLLLTFARPIGMHWLSDARSVPMLRVMAAALPFMSISGCVRGYYTARQKAGMSALSQLSEQAVRIGVGVPVISVLAKKGIAQACIGAVIADLCGEAAGCVCCAAALLTGAGKREAETAMGKRITSIALPITANFYLSNILRTVETALIPTCLVSYGMTRETALSQYGMITGMAIPVLFFPAAVLMAAGQLLLPEIARCQASGDRIGVCRCAEKSVRFTLTAAFPSAALIMLYAEELSMLLYDQPLLTRILLVLAPMLPLMYCETICTGLLRGLGEQKSLLLFSLTDSVVRLVLIVILVPLLGINGLLAVMVISNILTPALCLLRLRRVTSFETDWCRLLTAAAVSAALTIPFIAARKAGFLGGLPMAARTVMGALVYLLSFLLVISGLPIRLNTVFTISLPWCRIRRNGVSCNENRTRI